MPAKLRPQPQDKANPVKTNDSHIPAIQEELNQQKALARAIARIRQSLDLGIIFTTTAQEVRQLLKCDRVAVFCLDPQRNWEGEFVSEDVGENWPSALGAKVYDHCFGEKFAIHYQQGQFQVVADIYAAELSKCHVKILEQFQVRANLVVPLLQDETLWGLLCIHQCSGPRSWQPDEIEFIQQIADHLGVALQHDRYLQQIKAQAAELARAGEREKQAYRQKIVARIIDKIRQILDIETIFAIATQEVRQLLNTDRVAIYQFLPDWTGTFVAESVAEGWTPLVGTLPIIEDTHLQETKGGRYVNNENFAVDDIYQAGHADCHIQLLEQFEAKAYVIVPLFQGEHLWGLLAAYQNSAPRHWQEDEIDLLSQIGSQLTLALQQLDYLKQMQAQSAQLTKAAERERMIERQKILAAIVDKIRRSLDIETIFRTTTEEVQKLLQADRVIIYRFNPDWSGACVSESVAPEWISLLDQQIEPPRLTENITDNISNPIDNITDNITDNIRNISDCTLKSLAELTSTDTYLQRTQGGRFVQGQPFRTCNDIYQAGFTPCYLRVLESIQAKAYVIVGIYQGTKVWGLLAAYQNSAARDWQEEEVEVLSQIASQLGVALQQADYLNQVQNQAAQLAKAAERQRSLATTIDKIRQSLDIDTIFQITTQEVRRLLEVERVAIYRFYPDWSGEFVADSIVDGSTPQPAKTFAIEENWVTINQSGKCQYPRNETFVPILQGEKLWGLLVAYQTSHPRYWQDEEINLLAQVGVQLGIAIQQAELLEKTRRQAAELSQTLQNLQKTQTQMIQSEKMASLGQLVAGVAHEINNPINFIHGNLGYIGDYTQDLLELVQLYQAHYPEPAAEILEKVEEVDLNFISHDLPEALASMKIGTERIRQIVLSLRTFARHDEAEMKAVDIHQGIDSTLLILQHRLKSEEGREIMVVKNYGDLPKVECHGAQLNQVFMNVISNAIDAVETVENPTINISTNLIKSQALIQISDNGCGIPESILPQIFDPFFTTKKLGKGTGLGLSVSYQIIVEKHRGKLECSRLGAGSEFKITLPIHQ
jgi:GAF domain-containing protein